MDQAAATEDDDHARSTLVPLLLVDRRGSLGALVEGLVGCSFVVEGEVPAGSSTRPLTTRSKPRSVFDRA